MDSEKVTHLKVATSSTTDEKPLISDGHLKKSELAMGWVSCFFLQFYVGGLALALNVMYVEILNVFDTSSSEAALVQSLYTGLALGCGVVWTYPSSKLGVGNTIILTSLIGSIGLIVSAFAVNVLMIIVFTGVIAGLGHGYCFLVPSIVVHLFFTKNAGIFITALSSGASLGQIVLTYFMDYCFSEYSLSGSFLIFGSLGLNCVVCGAIVRLMEKRTSSIQREDKDRKALLKLSVLKDWKNSLLVFLSMLVTFCMMAETKFVVDLMVLRGYERQAGSFFASILGFANLLGRVFGTLLAMCARHSSALVEGCIASLVLAISHAMIVFVVSYDGLLIATLLNGFCFGLLVCKTPVYAVEVVGAEDFAAVFSLQILTNGAGNFIGGVIGGIIKDVTGNYSLMFIICIALSLVCALLFLILAIAVKVTKTRRHLYHGLRNDKELTESTRLLG